MNKTYTLFKRMSPHLAKKARNLVDAMLMSKNEIGWDSEPQLIVNRKVHHGSDIVKLISYVMFPADKEFRKPIGLKTFTTALEKIGLEADYVVNPDVKKVLAKNNGSDSENEELLDVDSESREDETGDESYYSGDGDEDSTDIDDGSRNHITKQKYDWKTVSGSENESETSENESETSEK